MNSSNAASAGPPSLTRIDPLQDRPALQPGVVDAPVPAAPVCPGCGGAGYYKEAVPYDHPHFGVLFPCTCRLVAQAQHATAELLRLSNLAARSDKTFATFDPLVPGVQVAYQQALAYARRPQGWLTLFGTYGVGKTHLAAAIANAVLARRCPVLFTVVPDLLDHLRATFGPESLVSYDTRFATVRDAPLLVLDDLGTEQATPWAREKLYQIVNHRYDERLPTVVTSNVTPEQIDGRIFSRLCDPDMGTRITIVAQDYRRRGQQT